MKAAFLIVLCFVCFVATAQPAQDSIAVKRLLDSINRSVDRAVVKKDMAALQTLYADDFYFLHATGKVDSRQSWFQSVRNQKSPYLSREHDSVDVELHGDVAIVAGTLTVKFPANTRPGYAVRYIRVFVNRNRTWQLISHRSTAEFR